MNTRIHLLVTALAIALGSAVLLAQGVVSSSAGAFLGDWTLAMESPQGTVSLLLKVKDVEGKVAGEITSVVQPDVQQITDVSRDQDALVMKYTGTYQGQPFSAKLTLTPDGEQLKVRFDFQNGQYRMTGVGTKK